MEEHLPRIKQWKLTEKEVDNLISCSQMKEMEFIVKNFPTERTLGPHGLPRQRYQTFKEKIIPVLLKLFREFKKEEYFLTYAEASINLICKPDKDITRKKAVDPCPSLT